MYLMLSALALSHYIYPAPPGIATQRAMYRQSRAGEEGGPHQRKLTWSCTRRIQPNRMQWKFPLSCCTFPQCHVHCKGASVHPRMLGKSSASTRTQVMQLPLRAALLGGKKQGALRCWGKQPPAGRGSGRRVTRKSLADGPAKNNKEADGSCKTTVCLQDKAQAG